DFPRFHVGLAEADLRNRKYQEAERHAQQALAYDATLGRAHRTLALALLGGRKVNEAIRSLERAIDLDPLDLAAYRLLVGIYEQTGNQQAADSVKARAARMFNQQP
ncbi:MAG: tetratricopeptide repeat protein, partial [Planctomycetota bacterium]